MKIIFLDIDGVLNNELFYKARYEKLSNAESNEDYQIQQFDPRCVDLLNHITRETGAKIVVSSTWRSNPNIVDILEKVGIKGDIIGITPHLHFSTNNKGYNLSSVPRGCEIEAWLSKNCEDYYDKKDADFKYVILDDDSDMVLSQKENYFLVDGYCGLTPNLSYRVINYLNNVQYF